ncbi:MAG TPA: amidohydrolase family protein [bacterium]|nr:amidohydrolase family protein [bacterium]
MSPRARHSLELGYTLLRYGYRGNSDSFDIKYVNYILKQVRASKWTDKVVLLALDGVYDADGQLDLDLTNAYVPNDYCRDVCAFHEELLYGASVNPDRRGALDELERVKEDGAVLIKWLPNSQNFDPGDKKYIPFYKKLAELDLPLLSHTGYEHSIHVYDQLYGNPVRLVYALDEGVKVIAAHGGTAGVYDPLEFFDEYLEMFDRHPNLYGDTAAITGITRFAYIPTMLEHPGFMERHLQATDYPAPPLPVLFTKQLGLKKALGIQFARNIFDRDIENKLALGFPESFLYNSAEVLGVDW